MPLPKTQDVGKQRRFIRKHHPGIPEKQEIAMALSGAREAGADIPEPRKRQKITRKETR